MVSIVFGWLSSNVQWVFSGVGILVVSLFVKSFGTCIRKKRVKKTKNSTISIAGNKKATIEDATISGSIEIKNNEETIIKNVDFNSNN